MISVGICHVHATPSDEYLEMVDELEALGVDRLWIPDQDFADDPFVLAAQTGLATSKLQVGIGITSPLLRHPMNLARSAATLRRLLGNRFLLGLGTGNVKNVLDPLGLRPGRPLAALSAGLSTVSSLLAGESVRFDPELPEVALDGSDGTAPALYVGARGPRTLQLAGSQADGVLIESRAAGESFADAVAHVRSGWDRRGADRAVDGFDMGLWQVVVVTDDPSAVYEKHKTWIARMIQAGPASAMRLAGVSERSIEVLGRAETREELEVAADRLTDEDRAAVVVAGSASDVAGVLGRAVEAGATSINVVGTSDVADTLRTAEALVKDVLPALARPRAGGPR